MDTAELDLAIDELEMRVERLRSLYEQYFLGIEKIEPAVARKDVDRRVWLLKREKIRNTARRFKLLTIIQRYNTFQQYWQRICREIENGTYRRHVLRAERATSTVSDVVAKQARDKAEALQKQATDAAAQAELQDMLARDVDAEQEFARAVADATRPHAQARAGRAPEPTPRARLKTLDLELEGLNPEAAASGEARSLPGSPERQAARPGNLLATLGTRPATLDGTQPATPAQRPGERRSRGDRPMLKPSLPRSAGDLSPEPPAAAREPAPRPPAIPPAGPPRVAPAARPPAPPAAARPPASPPPMATSKAGLTDQRIAELHRQLVATKLRTKETGKVSVDGLAKSLRAAESKLREQHKDRNIDFDVVVKNGKAVVKPIVR